MIKVDWIHRGLRRMVCLSAIILLALCFPKECWADWDGDDGFYVANQRYYVKMEDFTSRSGSTYVFESFRHSNDPLYYLGTNASLNSYPGFKLTLKGANIDLGYLFSSRWTLSDNITFPNGGQIIVEWPAYSPSDYSQLCFSFFSAYISVGGNLVKNLPGVSFEADETDPNSGYMLVYTSHQDEKGNYIDQTGSITINIPAGVKFGTNLYTNGMNISMGYPQKVVVRNNAEYWWESETTGDLKGRDLEYSGAEQKLLKPHSSFAASTGIFWFGGTTSYQNFHYRWRKTDHDGSNPTAWSEWSQEEPAATEVGRYEMQYYVQTNIQGMYGDPGTPEEADDEHHSPVVSRILRTLTDINDPVAINPMYNFHAQPLITAGISSQGSYMYKLVDAEDHILQDWEPTVPTATEVGTYTVYWYIAGDPTRFYKDVGNIHEPKGSTEITLVPLDLATATMIITDNEYCYDAKPHSAIVQVMCGAEVVTSDYYDIFYGPDKTDEYETEFGDYDVTIKATTVSPNFVGQQTCATTKLSIGKYDLANALASIGAQLYTGSQITPTVTSVTMNDNSLTPISPDNYEISYGPNINAGTGAGTVMVTAKAESANFKGTLVIPFDIQRRKVTVTAKPQTISYNSDGEFHSSGTAYVSLTLDPSYTDVFSLATLGHALKSAVLTCTDTDKGVGSYNTIYPANAKIYDGNGSGSNDVTANYEITYAAGTLAIAAKDLADANFAGDLSISGIEAEYAHTGSAIEPPLLKVRDKGKLLTNGPTGDYQVSYSNNTAVGTATMTITFNSGGNYTYTGGSLQRTFDIYYAVDAYERTGDANFYRTYYNYSEDLEIRDNTKFGIYKGAANDSRTAVVLTEAGTVIPKQMAVMLVATETPVKLYKAADTSGAGDFSDNALQGGATHTAALDGSEHYYIFNGDAFIWATEGVMDANKAFIDGNGWTVSHARIMITFAHDNETTDIIANSPLPTANSEDHWYDLQGRKLDSKPTKAGLYIRNGRKVVVKDKQ